MIKYNLTCKCKCTFDSWFANSNEFERLFKKKLITCIECNSHNISKSIMAPNIANTKKSNDVNVKQIKNIKKKILEYQRFIKDNCKDVGTNFAQEARSIHYNKKKSKNIYGKATSEEIKELQDEGIETTTIPWYENKEN
tara:strand:- start:1107 stop:1523 length:417 start_codon:yes stop_codon:yes gene_type:complete